MPKEIKHTKQASNETTEKSPKGLNNATIKAGLSFNVNETKKWLKRQFEINDQEVPLIRGAHVALTAIVESMISSILSVVVSNLPKEKSGLYAISRPSISYTMQLDADYRSMFWRFIETYNPDTNYGDQFWISQNFIMKYIEKIHGDNIKLDNKGYNFLAYLLLNYCVTITRTATIIMTSLEKKSLDHKLFKCAVKIHTAESLINSIFMKVDDATKVLGDGEDEDGEDNAEEHDEDEEKPSKNSKSAKGSKESTKDSKKKDSKKAVEDSDDENDESDNSDNEESDGDDSGDESEEEEETAKKKVIAKGKAKETISKKKNKD